MSNVTICVAWNTKILTHELHFVEIEPLSISGPESASGHLKVCKDRSPDKSRKLYPPQIRVMDSRSHPSCLDSPLNIPDNFMITEFVYIVGGHFYPYKPIRFCRYGHVTHQINETRPFSSIYHIA
jgi:hypothetical protein